jgi:hypothetical protein
MANKTIAEMTAVTAVAGMALPAYDPDNPARELNSNTGAVELNSGGGEILLNRDT